MTLLEKLEQSLEMLLEFKAKAYTKDIEYELSSIEKYYNIKIYGLRHESDS